MLNPHFRQIFLQFPYFRKELEECESLYEKLIYALKNMYSWERMPDALKEQVFEHLGRLAAVANLSEENRVAYDKAVDRFRVGITVEEDARWQGIQEGREKGIQEGREQESIAIARKLKQRGMTLEEIADVTGLSIKDIENL